MGADAHSLKVGLPSGLQVVADVLAWGAWGNGVFAVFGTKGMAANNYVSATWR